MDPQVENRKNILSTTTPPTLDEEKVGALWSIKENVSELNAYRP